MHNKFVQVTEMSYLMGVKISIMCELVFQVKEIHRCFFLFTTDRPTESHHAEQREFNWGTALLHALFTPSYTILSIDTLPILVLQPGDTTAIGLGGLKKETGGREAPEADGQAA